MDPKEVKELCTKSLVHSRLGKDDTSIQDGKDFYKFLFATKPELKHYFKGAENFTPDDIQKSERFAVQGQRILLACHIVATLFDNKATFKAYARETVNRHIHDQVNLEPSLWKAFYAVFVGYLKTKTTIDDKTEKAWLQIGDEFSAECRNHLADLGLPH